MKRKYILVRVVQRPRWIGAQGNVPCLVARYGVVLVVYQELRTTQGCFCAFGRGCENGFVALMNVQLGRVTSIEGVWWGGGDGRLRETEADRLGTNILIKLSLLVRDASELIKRTRQGGTLGNSII